jgi:hypothetical protein
MDEKERSSVPEAQTFDTISPATSKDYDETYEVYKTQAVHDIDPNEARRVLRTIEFHIMPLLMGTYMVSGPTCLRCGRPTLLNTCIMRHKLIVAGIVTIPRQVQHQLRGGKKYPRLYLAVSNFMPTLWSGGWAQSSIEPPVRAETSNSRPM